MIRLFLIRTITLVVCCFVIGWPCLFAQETDTPVTLTLPQLTATPGEILEIDVQISDVTGLNVVSSDLTIIYDARVLTADRPLINGTFTNRWSEAHRVGFVEGSQDTMGLIDIALATANRIPEGAGVFLKVRFQVSDSAQEGQVSPLTFAEAILNNGTPSVTTVAGIVTVATQQHLVGDFNGDCQVDFQDFIVFAKTFGSQSGDSRYNPDADFDSDGFIGFADFVVLVQNFGQICDHTG